MIGPNSDPHDLLGDFHGEKRLVRNVLYRNSRTRYFQRAVKLSAKVRVDFTTRAKNYFGRAVLLGITHNRNAGFGPKNLSFFLPYRNFAPCSIGYKYKRVDRFYK